MYSYSEIKPSVRHFRSREVSKTRNPNGSWHRVYRGEEYYETKIGMLRMDEWEKIAFEVVEENGDLPLLEAIMEHVRDRCRFIKKKDLKVYALDCLLNESYKAWEKRGEFITPLKAKGGGGAGD